MHFLRTSLLAAALAAATIVPVLAGPVSGAADAPHAAQAGRETFTVRSSDGTMLAGEAQGNPDAPEILFIHGLGQSRLSWNKQFADPALAGFRLVRFDLRGHGNSDKPASAAAYADPKLWADDIKAVMEQAGLKRPVLVGWSLGGYAAGAYLAQYGGSGIAGVNLVDAVVKISPELLTPLAGRLLQAIISDDLAVRSTAIPEFLAACFSIPPTTEEFDAMLAVNGMAERAVAKGFVASPLTDLEPVFNAYAGPILLTHGAHDQLVRVAMSEVVQHSNPRSELQLYEDSGHSPFFEEPTRFDLNLATFVAGTRGVPATKP